ncbi:hypothetical protein [Nocardia sp. NPDC004711]
MSDSTAVSTAAQGSNGASRVALYTEAFAADPHGHYRAMRERYGVLAPVELAPGVPATLVLGYRLAVRILHDEDRFPADPSIWELGVPATCPVRPMMESRPNAIRSAGADHQRYRLPITAALNAVDLHRMHEIVEGRAGPLIDAFCIDGHCDVVSQYALPVTIDVLNSLLGCGPEISERAATGVARMLDSGADAADGTGDSGGGAARTDRDQTRLSRHRRHEFAHRASGRTVRRGGAAPAGVAICGREQSAAKSDCHRAVDDADRSPIRQRAGQRCALDPGRAR